LYQGPSQVQSVRVIALNVVAMSTSTALPRSVRSTKGEKMNKTRDYYGVIVHPKHFKALLEMKPEEAGAILKNMINTFQGNEDEIIVFNDRYLDYVSEDICSLTAYDKSLKDARSNAGKKSAENKRATKLQQTCNKTSTTLQQECNVNIKDKVNIKDNNNIGFKPNAFTSGCPKSDIDFEEIERNLIKN
jgi:hypothetical protein